jgi:hypothetical protein
MEEVLYGRFGMHTLFGTKQDVHAATYGSTATSMSVSTRLYDDADPFEDPYPEWGKGVKARVYGYRRGLYFCISYGGRQSQVLSPGEYAMDLSKTSAKFNCDLFPSGEVRFQNLAVVNGGINVAGVSSGTFGILALVATVEPPVALVFGTVSGIFALVDAADLDAGIDGKAEGALYKVIIRHPPGCAPFCEKEVVQRSDDGDSGWIDSSWVKTGKACNAGDQYTIFVELDSAASAISRMVYSIDVSQTTEYKCDSESDFSTGRIAIRE